MSKVTRRWWKDVGLLLDGGTTGEAVRLKPRGCLGAGISKVPRSGVASGGATTTLLY